MSVCSTSACHTCAECTLWREPAGSAGSARRQRGVVASSPIPEWGIGVADKAVGFGFSFYSQVKALMRVAACASAGGFAVGFEAMGFEAMGFEAMGFENWCGYDVA